MAKHNSKKKKQSAAISPLNSSIVDDDVIGDTTDNNNNASSNNDTLNDNNTRRPPRVMSDTKLSEEAALTARLFGGGGGSDDDAPSSNYSAAWMDDDDDNVESNNTRHQDGDDGDKGVYGSGDLFAIDRSGEEVTDDYNDVKEDEEKGINQDVFDNNRDDEENNEEEYEEEMGEDKASMGGAAWQDLSSDSESGDSESDDDDDSSEDDDNNNNSTDDNNSKNKKKGVSLVEGPNRLKKLRRYADETNPISLNEYEVRLRERFMNTSSVAANTSWANVGLAQKQQQQQESEEPLKKKKRKERGYASSTDEDDSSDDEEYGGTAESKLLQSNTSLFQTSSSGLQLPPTLLNITRSRDANLSDPNNSVINATQFHPGSDEDSPLLMTAGMDKMLRFFRINSDGEEESTKIHGIQFPKMPITCASFLGNSGSVVLSGRRPFFYVYDAISGNIQKIPSIVGRTERSLEKFVVSSNGSMIAFIGNDGYIILVDGTTYQWIGDLKMNGSVRAITFTEDGEYILGSGSDGDVYRWHIGSRRCVERFHNEDGTITSSLAMSNNFLAVAAESGVVNLYNDRQAPSRSSGGGGHGVSLAATEHTPVKSIMNLTTSADNVCFNHDGQILAMSTQRETNGLKLLHVPTATVFSNWPTSKTPLKYVWSMDFSPGSKYLAIGNDHGKCLLYRLKHYWE